MYLILAGFAVIAIALFLYLRGEPEPGPGPEPPPGEGDNTTRIHYYNDLKLRGGKWLQAADEFWTKTTDAMTNAEIYTIYQEVFYKYEGEPGEPTQYPCSICDEKFTSLEGLQEHLSSAHKLPTKASIEASYDSWYVHDSRQVASAHYHADLISYDEFVELNGACSRRGYYLDLWAKGIGWRPIAEKYWTATAGINSHTELYSIYLAHLAMAPEPPEPEPSTINEQLASIMPNLKIVWLLRAGTWLYFDPKDMMSDLKIINRGEVAWIYVKETCQFTQGGRTLTLYADKNNSVAWM